MNNALDHYGSENRGYAASVVVVPRIGPELETDTNIGGGEDMEELQGISVVANR
jgi:hypothetical protein